MAKREDIPREPVPDGRKGTEGCGWDHQEKQHDAWGNPIGHDVFSKSPCDHDPKIGFRVPDCAYKGFDTFTWPEGKVCEYELPGETEERQTDDYEDIQPKR